MPAGSGTPRPGRAAGEFRTGRGTAAPAGWPDSVAPPGTADWQTSAAAWLLDLLPPDYRGEQMLRGHPLVLVRLAAWYVAGQREAARRALATVRVDLEPWVEPHVVTETLRALDTDDARAAVAQRQVAMVEHALRGGTFRAVL